MKFGMLLTWLAVMTVASCSAFPRGAPAPLLSVHSSPTENSVKFIAVSGPANNFDSGFFDSSFIVQNFQRSVEDALISRIQPFVEELKRTAVVGRTEVINQISSSLAPVVTKNFGIAFTEARRGHTNVAHTAFDLNLARQTVAELLQPLDKIFYDAFISVNPHFHVPLSTFTGIFSGLHGAVAEVFDNRRAVLTVASPAFVASVVAHPFREHLRQIFAAAAPGLAIGGSSLANIPGLFGAPFEDSTRPHGPLSTFGKPPVRITGNTGRFGVAGTSDVSGSPGTTIVTATSLPTVNGFKPQGLVVTAGSTTGPGTASPHGIIHGMRGRATTVAANVRSGNPSPPKGSFGGVLGAFQGHRSNTIF